jgi:hypothetical protein
MAFFLRLAIALARRRTDPPTDNSDTGASATLSGLAR